MSEYAKCEDCGKEMAPKKGCRIRYIENPKGKGILLRIPNMTENICHDCNSGMGQIHHYGCDMERCPICNGQLISCECFENNEIEEMDKLDIDIQTIQEQDRAAHDLNRRWKYE